MMYPLETLSGCCFFEKVFIRHLIIRKTVRFKALTQILFSKVKGPALPKERWRKGFAFFFCLPKVGATHEVHPWKIVWVLFLNKGLIRQLIIWKTLHFKALTQIFFSKVKGPALPKERWRKGFVFFHSQKLVLTIGYHPNNYNIE